MKTDKMQEMFDYQRKFGLKFRDYNNPKPEELFRLILCLYEEVGELQSSIGWKPFRNSCKESLKSNKLEEVVDILKYLMEITMYLGFSWSEVRDMFYTKSSVCEYRYKQEFLTSLNKIALVDIDGVLTDYPQGFLSQVKLQPSNKYLKMFDISKDLDIPYQDLRSIKHEWRESGGYEKLESRHLFVPKVLKDNGFDIVLLSNRPFHKYKRIWGDTLKWLIDRDVLFDSLLFSEDEKVDIFKSLSKESIKVTVEDDPSHIRRYVSEGLTVLVPGYPYNKEVHALPQVKVFKDEQSFRQAVGQL